MLKNKTDKEVEIKYNSVVITVAPDGSLDVRDFGVTSNTTLITACEKHICKKNPNVFESFSDEKQTELKKETFNKIKELESEVVDLKKAVDVANKAKDKAVKEKDKHVGEVVAAMNQVKDLKDEIKLLQAKLKAAQ